MQEQFIEMKQKRIEELQQRKAIKVKQEHQKKKVQKKKVLVLPPLSAQ